MTGYLFQGATTTRNNNTDDFTKGTENTAVRGMGKVINTRTVTIDLFRARAASEEILRDYENRYADANPVPEVGEGGREDR